MFIEPSTALSVAGAAFEHRQFFIRSLKRLRLWLRRGILRVAIFGPGGSGKTTLASFLSGNLDLNTPTQYQESIDKEVYKLGNLVVQLLVPPGQKRRRDFHHTQLFQKMAQGSVTAVINVVCYGYHSFQKLSYKDFPFYQEGMPVSKFLDQHLANGKKDELAILKTLVPRLLDAKSNIWMLTVVTKQDLWWNGRKSVRAHYTEGDYDKLISHISQKRGEQHFRHEYVSVAPVMSNFVSGTGELLTRTAAGYDQNIQYANLNEMLKIVQSLAKRK